MKRTLQALLFAFVAITMPIGAWAQESTAEAKWGTSAQSLTNEGTLADAFAAAYRYDEEIGSYIATDIAYIQLQSDVTTDVSNIIYGGTFTLDINGQTLTSDSFTLDIRNEGTSVTLTDSSVDGTGKVICTGSGCMPVFLADGAHATIEGGCYESNTEVLYVISGSTALITGGTFTSSSRSVILNDDGTIAISGGSFGGEDIWSSVRIVSGNTTITGGTFAEGTDGTIAYYGGKLDLTGYPTATEGTTPLTDISVFSRTTVTVSDETIALPTGYCFYLGKQAVTALEDYMRYTIGAWAQESIVEAKWGTSAQSLTNEGTLADAIAAAYRFDEEIGRYTATDIAYIQLQSDVTTDVSNIIYGGTFTLDINGQTLTSDSFTLDIRNEGTSVTLTDSSVDGTGKVICTSSSCILVFLSDGAHATIEGGCYESKNEVLSVTSGSTALITGGTFTSSSSNVFSNDDGTLAISGGSFGGENIQSYVIIVSGSTTISGGSFGGENIQSSVRIIGGSTTITGGTFTEGTYGTIEYRGGKIDLTGYSTTATEGTTPLTDISVFSTVDVTVGAETLALPTGYCFYLGEQAVTALEAYEKYTIKTRGEDTMGIEKPESTVNGGQRAVIYDLSGRRVTHPTKGIYIVNGKKVIFK